MREIHVARLARRLRRQLWKVYGGRIENRGGALMLIGGDTTLDIGGTCCCSGSLLGGSTTITWAEYVRFLTDYEADADGNFLIDGYKFQADGSVLLDPEPAWYEIPVESDNSEIEAGPRAPDAAWDGPQTTADGPNGADRKAA